MFHHVCSGAVRPGGLFWFGLALAFLSKDGPDEEEGREKLNKEKAAFAAGAQDRESADAGSISGTAAKLPGCRWARQLAHLHLALSSHPPNTERC